MPGEFPPLPRAEPRFARRDNAAPQVDLYPFGRELNGRIERGHFIADDRWEEEIAYKIELLERDASLRRVIIDDDLPGLVEALWRVADLLAADEPTLWRAVEGGVELPRLGLRLGITTEAERFEPVIDASSATELGIRVGAWLERQRGVERLFDALALACQEDIVIMRGVPDGIDIAEALHVCFPSGWDPREKAGTNFATIHQPVAESEKLVGSSQNLMKALLTKGPYVRFGWGVGADADLDNHPETPRRRMPTEALADPDLVAANAWTRTERQTTFPMPDLGRGLFTIRVYVDPLIDRVREEPYIGERLIKLIESATPAVREYKGFAPYAEPLLAWLNANCSTPTTHQG
ncbi:MAG: DUF3445 domain-containing protein [Thermomicrobiales bacterium]|nr:DUF3445 domain-containing protein [Thermomicrobiales bacterium]